MSSRLIIQLVGAGLDKGDVRLHDFIDQLQTVKRALRETEIALSGHEEAMLDYKVVDLKHSSPATLTLQAIPADGDVPAELIAEVIQSFTKELGLIKSAGELLMEPELSRLLAYQDIGVKPNSRIEKVMIRASGKGGKQVTIDQKFKKRLEDIVGPDEFAEGAISGLLEAVNFHNTNRFTLYPVIGPRKVVGKFATSLRPKIKEAIGCYVTIFGELRYKAWSPYPHGVTAENLDIHEPDSELPSLTEMRGTFGGSTGNLNSAEFVDQMRNENYEA